MKAIFILAGLSCILLVADSARACTCNLPPPACFEYSRTEAVFIGTVKKVAQLTDGPSLTFETVDLSVDESFRGISTPSIKTYNYAHSCAFRFKTGESYLFYGVVDKLNEFETGLCTRTTLLKSDLIDLQFLRAVKNDLPVYWAWGTISRGHFGVPLAGVRAEVLGQRTKIQGFSNSDGDIKLEVPKPGTYRIRIHLPKGQADINGPLRNEIALSEMQRKQIVGGRLGGSRPYVDYQVKVEANRCGWFDVSIPEQ